MKRILIILMYKQHTRSSSCRLLLGRQFLLKNGVIFRMLCFPPVMTGCWDQ
ncbi:hypothetical protein [Spiroplasma sp. ald]|uniref:hypothetical protein n=1 Tax=Spiroplasma sp. ald TaxID=2490849 RepID=UPI0037DDD617